MSAYSASFHAFVADAVHGLESGAVEPSQFCRLLKGDRERRRARRAEEAGYVVAERGADDDFGVMAENSIEIGLRKFMQRYITVSEFVEMIEGLWKAETMLEREHVQRVRAGAAQALLSSSADALGEAAAPTAALGAAPAAAKQQTYTDISLAFATLWGGADDAQHVVSQVALAGELDAAAAAEAAYAADQLARHSSLSALSPLAVLTAHKRRGRSADSAMLADADARGPITSTRSRPMSNRAASRSADDAGDGAARSATLAARDAIVRDAAAALLSAPPPPPRPRRAEEARANALLYNFAIFDAEQRARYSFDPLGPLEAPVAELCVLSASERARGAPPHSVFLLHWLKVWGVVVWLNDGVALCLLSKAPLLAAHARVLGALRAQLLRAAWRAPTQGDASIPAAALALLRCCAALPLPSIGACVGAQIGALRARCAPPRHLRGGVAGGDGGEARLPLRPAALDALDALFADAPPRRRDADEAFAWGARYLPSPALVVSILHAVLLGASRVVFVGERRDAVAGTAIALESLLRPLRWQGVFAPLLSVSLLPVLAAPVPVLCGALLDDWERYVEEVRCAFLLFAFISFVCSSILLLLYFLLRRSAFKSRSTSSCASTPRRRARRARRAARGARRRSRRGRRRSRRRTAEQRMRRRRRSRSTPHSHASLPRSRCRVERAC